MKLTPTIDELKEYSERRRTIKKERKNNREREKEFRISQREFERRIDSDFINTDHNISMGSLTIYIAKNVVTAITTSHTNCKKTNTAGTSSK